MSPDDPTRVAVLMDVADMDAFASGMQSEAAAEAMEHDGFCRDDGDPHRGIDELSSPFSWSRIKIDARACPVCNNRVPQNAGPGCASAVGRKLLSKAKTSTDQGTH